MLISSLSAGSNVFPATRFSSQRSPDDSNPNRQSGYGLGADQDNSLRSRLIDVHSKPRFKPWMWVATFVPALVASSLISLQNKQAANQHCLIMETQRTPLALATTIEKVCEVKASPVFQLPK